MTLWWTAKPTKPAAVAMTVRRCRVCEWQGDIIGPIVGDLDCPWCHGPTDLLSPVAAADVVKGFKNPHAAALGRLGGHKGGAARAAALTRNQRHAIAQKAARARWAKAKRSKS